MNKIEIREQYKNLRKALSSEDVEAKSKAISNLLFSRIPIHRFSVVHVFLPIKKNNEPDTSFIIETLKKDFPTDIYISKSLENGEMLHILYKTDTVLEKNQWGIEEPSDVSEALDSKAFFDKFEKEDILVLIPLLAFDKTGNRVGYGKGYYDRFLAYSHATKIGLSLLEPIDLITDVDPRDIKMDYCITAERVFSF